MCPSPFARSTAHVVLDLRRYLFWREPGEPQRFDWFGHRATSLPSNRTMAVVPMRPVYVLRLATQRPQSVLSLNSRCGLKSAFNGIALPHIVLAAVLVSCACTVPVAQLTNCNRCARSMI